MEDFLLLHWLALEHLPWQPRGPVHYIVQVLNEHLFSGGGEWQTVGYDKVASD